MAKLCLAAFIAVVAALALLRSHQMLRWVRGEATFLGTTGPVSCTGQALPISFRLSNGTEAHGALRNYSRGGLPRTGKRFQIRYDPDDPGRTEWAAAVPLLVLVLAALLTVLALVLRQSLRELGSIV